MIEKEAPVQQNRKHVKDSAEERLRPRVYVTDSDPDGFLGCLLQNGSLTKNVQSSELIMHIVEDGSLE